MHSQEASIADYVNNNFILTSMFEKKFGFKSGWLSENITDQECYERLKMAEFCVQCFYFFMVRTF